MAKKKRPKPEPREWNLVTPGVVGFNQLNDSCMIIITTFDIFKRGLYRYIFEGMYRECPDLKLDDGAIRVYSNSSCTNRENFSQKFLILWSVLQTAVMKMRGGGEWYGLFFVYRRYLWHWRLYGQSRGGYVGWSTVC